MYFPKHLVGVDEKVAPHYYKSWRLAERDALFRSFRRDVRFDISAVGNIVQPLCKGRVAGGEGNAVNAYAGGIIHHHATVAVAVIYPSCIHRRCGIF